MQLTARDRRALAILAGAAALACLVYFWPEEQDVVSAQMTAAQAERRLTALRQKAATAPFRETTMTTIRKELEGREKGLIQSGTIPQAQAQLLQVVRRVGRAQQPALEFRTTEFGTPRRLAGAYGVISLSLSMDCGIEQIVNFLAELANQPEYLRTSDLQLNYAQNPKNKLIPARITVSALVPKDLVPEKQENAF